jgi:carboxyl-terminal processing protease
VVPPATRRSGPVLPVAIAVVALLAGGALFMSGYTMGRESASEPGTPAGADAAFRPFWDTYHTINERYAGGPVDREAIIQGAIRGMIAALDDPYSSYLTSKEYRDSLQGISGEFEGIGAEIATQAADGTQGCTTIGPACRLVIVAPIAGSPAQKADLRTGDLVLATNGVSLDGLTMDGARERIRGPKGSVVTLTVQRGTQEPFPLKITRDVIQQEEVESRDYANGTVGYIRLNGFSDTAATELTAALRAHIDAKRTRIILDLRGNPGGFVTAARTVASQFIAAGPIFWEQDASGAQVATDALPGGIATSDDIQVMCLIDGGSASASEIVAGALQDTGRATLVGQTSFGKGTVQQWQELTGEGGAFRLTIARWLTPNKRWIHHVGLVPQVPVAVPANPKPGDDPTLDKALELLGGAAGAAPWADAA